MQAHPQGDERRETASGTVPPVPDCLQEKRVLDPTGCLSSFLVTRGGGGLVTRLQTSPQEEERQDEQKHRLGLSGGGSLCGLRSDAHTDSKTVREWKVSKSWKRVHKASPQPRPLRELGSRGAFGRH